MDKASLRFVELMHSSLGLLLKACEREHRSAMLDLIVFSLYSRAHARPRPDSRKLSDATVLRTAVDLSRCAPRLSSAMAPG